MSEQERKEWPKAYRWHQDEDDVIILHHEDEHVFCAMGFEWWYAKVLSENADSVANTGKPCWIEADAPESAIRLADELTQLRTDLAQARHEATSWQTVAEGMGEELRRLKERVADLDAIEAAIEAGEEPEPHIKRYTKLATYMAGFRSVNQRLIDENGKAFNQVSQLRTQLADARRIISELEAAQGIAGIELKRLRELAKARKATISDVNKKQQALKAGLRKAIDLLSADDPHGFQDGMALLVKLSGSKAPRLKALQEAKPTPLHEVIGDLSKSSNH